MKCKTFDGKVMSEAAWLENHKDHEIVEEVKEFPLDEGNATKQMYYRKCINCTASHLYKMETIVNT